MMNATRLRAVVFGALTAAITACDSKSDEPEHTASASEPAKPNARGARDACSLITKEEVNAILGTAFSVRPGKSNGPPTCEYVPTASKKLNGFTLTVYWSGGKEALAVTKAGTRIAKAAMKGTQVDPMSMMALEPIDDLGNEAYFNPMIGSSVLAGDTLLEFDIRAMMWHQSLEGGKELWKQLVGKALARL